MMGKRREQFLGMAGKYDELHGRITQPLTVEGAEITARDVCGIIDGIANVPNRFKAIDLLRYVPDRRLPSSKPASVHFEQEVLNRLFQRWRKIGLIEFSGGKWELERGAWPTMQDAVSKARSLG